MVPDNFTISYTLGPLYLNTAEVSMKLFSFAYFICVLGVCCLKIWKSMKQWLKLSLQHFSIAQKVQM